MTEETTVSDQACPRCWAATPASARFCAQCGTGLKELGGEERARAGLERARSRRPVTVMFCDLVDSTAISTGMDAEDFSALIEDCHACVTAAVTAHNGMVARYMGDGLLAFFGYPRSGEDDAERAVRAGLAVLRVTPEVVVNGHPMRVRIGIATGVVVVGDIVGGGGPGGVDAAGEVPNLAARLQAAAGPGGLLIDRATRQLVAGRFECAPLGEMTLKGWAAPVPAWRVIRAAAPADPGPETATTPFVGREAELSRLLAAWREIGKTGGGAVVLVGEMGIGKSRLAGEFLRQAGAAAGLTRRWYGSRYMQGAALHPVVREIERQAGITVEDKQPERRGKLEAFLAGIPALDRALMIELMAPGVAAASVAGLSPDRRRELTLVALRDFVHAQSAGDRMLAIFEDHHWADPSSRAWLEVMARGIAAFNGLLIVTARPGGEPEWTHAPHVTRIDLDALTPVEAARMVAQSAGESRLPAGVVDEIVGRCDGVPLFLEEVTRLALGAPDESVRPAPARPLPLSIHASLISRLDGLGPARETAQVAAVIGREFRADLLARVMGRTATAVEPDLSRMRQAGLVRDAGGGVYRFRHALIQDAAYDSLLRQRRRVLHGQVGATLRALFPTLAETEPQLLALHYTEAEELEEAVSWWHAASVRSLAQSAVAEGLEQLKRGLTLLLKLPDTPRRRELELNLMICRGKAHVATTGHASEPVESSFRRARELSRSLPGAPQLLTATFGQWAHYITRGPLEEAAKLSAEIGAMAALSGNKVVEMYSAYTAGMTEAQVGRFDSSRPILERGIAACEALDPALYLASAVGDPKAVMRAYLAKVVACQGRLEDGRRIQAQALRDARETGLSYSIAMALNIKVTIEAFGGAPDEGDADLDAVRDFARSRGMVFFEAVELLLRGWKIARRGDTETGLAMLRDGLRPYRATQSRIWIYSFLRMQAEVLGWRGQLEEALAVLDEAAEAGACIGSGFEASPVARVRGEVLARAGRPREAAAAFSHAEALAAAGGAHLHAAQARAARDQAVRAGWLPETALMDVETP